MTPPRDDPERDRWLAEALRHAPDADAAPPAELSAAILRQARNAVRTPVAASRAGAQTGAGTRPHPLLALWSWLARPPIAAGFASMMVALLVGVMWWDRPIDETLPPRATVATAPAPTPTPSRDAAPPAEARPPVAAQAPAPGGDRADTTTAAPAAAPRPASPAPTAKPERATVDRAAPAEARKRSADVAAKQEVEREAAPRPAPGAQTPAPAPAQAPAMAAAPAPAPPVVAENSARTRDEARAEPRAAAGALSKAAPAAAPNALRSPAIVRPGTLGVPAERWSWRRDDAEPHAMTPTLQAWLAQLDRLARWRPAGDAPPADALTLRLARDGAPHTTIAIGADAVWLTPEQGAPLTAPLGAAAAAALKESLRAAAP